MLIIVIAVLLITSILLRSIYRNYKWPGLKFIYVLAITWLLCAGILAYYNFLCIADRDIPIYVVLIADKYTCLLVSVQISKLSVDSALRASIVSVGVEYSAILVAIMGLCQGLLSNKEQLIDLNAEVKARYGFSDWTRIKKPGHDDVDWMLKHYQPASKVVVFAGDYDKILKHRHMQTYIKNNKSKFTLFSDETEEYMDKKHAANELYQEVRDRFVFDSGMKSKCSFLTTEDKDTLLMRSWDKDDFNVCIVDATEETRALIAVIKNFVEAHTATRV